jgi:GTPase
MSEYLTFNNIKTAVSVSLILPHHTKHEALSSLEEIKLLARTLGISVVQEFKQHREKIEPDYYIGQGKLEEIKAYIDANPVDAILFDNELSGIQARNLEEFFGKKILGRTEIILYIFQSRAKTKEAKMQVELAFLEYMKPRLRHRWEHFSRVEGGIGARGGEGEKQIELDKRMVNNQISVIKKRLDKIDIQMKNRRKNRLNQNLVSLVGYTNAGKSTLFNLLAKTKQFTEDMLFATLDSTVRRVYIHDQLTILLNDTVGFINKLPHHLVASFKSTLDEVLEAGLLLHVIDVASPNLQSNINAVNQTLKDIGADHIPVIRVFNKVDLLSNGAVDTIIQKEDHDIFISALKNEGIDLLKQRIADFYSIELN